MALSFCLFMLITRLSVVSAYLSGHVLPGLVVVVGKACTRRHNYRVTSAPPSRLSLRKQKCLRRNSPSSVSGLRSSGGKLFQIRGLAAGKLRSPKRVRDYGSSGRCMCQRRLHANGGETCQRKPRCNGQPGKTAPSHATTYKLARLAYSRHDAERQPTEVPQNRSNVIPSPCTRDQAGSSVLYGLQPPE